MRKVISIVLFLCTLCSFAQTVPDYEKRIYQINNGDGTVSYTDIEGNIISKYKYKQWCSSYLEDHGFGKVMRNGYHGVINHEGREIVPCKYAVSCFTKSFKGVLYFFMITPQKTIDCYDGNGNLVFTYDKQPIVDINAANFFEGLVIMLKNNKGKWGAINYKGQQVIDFIYDDCRWLNDKVMLVEKNGAFGAIGRDGKVKIPFEICDSEGSEDGSAAICKDKAGRLLIVSPDGNITKVPGVYASFLCANEGRIAVQSINGLWGYLDEKTGKLVIDCKYKDVRLFFSGLAFVSKDGKKFGYIDINGKNITPFCYLSKWHNRAYNGIAIVCKNGKYGAIDRTGKEFIPCEYDGIADFENNPDYTTIEKDGLRGIVSKHGTIVLPLLYEDLRYSIGNLAAIKQNGKWGYIDIHTRKMAVPFIYDDAFGFYDGDDVLCADVYIKGEKGLITSDGREVVPCGEEDFERRKDLYFASNVPSDVDINIPSARSARSNTFAVIIANEEYMEDGISRVDYATNDGNVFKEYCQKVLGIPESNIRYRKNATLNQMRSEVNKIKDIARAYDGKANFIVYYSGHGVPDEQSASSYLLPADGMATDFRSAYSLAELYGELGNISAGQVTLFLDACFSGVGKDDRMLANARGVVIKAKPETPRGNMVVFSAAQGDETAYQYKKKKHGMFTYFLLKKLQESKGDVTLGELGQYITSNVKRQSIVTNSKLQTPCVSVSPMMQGTWRSSKLR